MSEQVITTKTGTYGRFQVTLPMDVKQKMLDWDSFSMLYNIQTLSELVLY